MNNICWMMYIHGEQNIQIKIIYTHVLHFCHQIFILFLPISFYLSIEIQDNEIAKTIPQRNFSCLHLPLQIPFCEYKNKLDCLHDTTRQKSFSKSKILQLYQFGETSHLNAPSPIKHLSLSPPLPPPMLKTEMLSQAVKDEEIHYDWRRGSHQL